MKILRCENGSVEAEIDKDKKKLRFWHDRAMSLDELNEVVDFFERSGVSVGETHIRNAPSFLVMARLQDDTVRDTSAQIVCPLKKKVCLFCALSCGELRCGTSKDENHVSKMKECPSDVIRSRKGGKRRMAEKSV